MAHLLVLTHGPLVGPARLRPLLDGRAATLPWRAVDLDGGEPLPALTDDVAGVVALGGIMDVDDDDPWLGPERDLLAAAVADGTPVLGVCLGAQQLGLALGGAVGSLPAVHGAVAPLRRTAGGRDHGVVAGWPDGARALFHHGDVVTTLPPGAVPLLEGDVPSVAAWRDADDVALAVQFHPEADADVLARWTALQDDPPYDAQELVARARAADPRVRAACVGLVARWLDERVLSRLDG